MVCDSISFYFVQSLELPSLHEEPLLEGLFSAARTADWLRDHDLVVIVHVVEGSPGALEGVHIVAREVSLLHLFLADVLPRLRHFEQVRLVLVYGPVVTVVLPLLETRGQNVKELLELLRLLSALGDSDFVGLLLEGPVEHEFTLLFHALH